MHNQSTQKPSTLTLRLPLFYAPLPLAVNNATAQSQTEDSDVLCIVLAIE